STCSILPAAQSGEFRQYAKVRGPSEVCTSQNFARSKEVLELCLTERVLEIMIRDSMKNTERNEAQIEVIQARIDQLSLRLSALVTMLALLTALAVLSSALALFFPRS